jgi:hypothetical protein
MFSATRHSCFPTGVSNEERALYLKQFYRRYDILPQIKKQAQRPGRDLPVNPKATRDEQEKDR